MDSAKTRLTILWSLAEGGVFAYLLAPMFREALRDLAGSFPAAYVGPVLFIMLALMSAGAFCCMSVLGQAWADRHIHEINRMGVSVFFVMLVHVLLVYRKWIDAALAPWVARHSGWEMGSLAVLALGSCAWIALRGLLWILFAKEGSAAIVAKLRGPKPSRPSTGAPHR